MFYTVLSIHVALCVALVLLVLLQQGKGADMGPALGGASGSVFGAAGAKTVLSKMTTGVAIGFMITSGILVATYSTYADSVNIEEPLPISIPAASEPAAASESVEGSAPVAAAPAATAEAVKQEVPAAMPPAVGAAAGSAPAPANP